MRLMSELMQLEIGISTKRYFPAIGTAGFERFSVKGYNLEPCPPPKIMESTLEFFQLAIGLKWTSGNTLKKKIFQFQIYT